MTHRHVSQMRNTAELGQPPESRQHFDISLWTPGAQPLLPSTHFRRVSPVTYVPCTHECRVRVTDIRPVLAVSERDSQPIAEAWG